MRFQVISPMLNDGEGRVAKVWMDLKSSGLLRPYDEMTDVGNTQPSSPDITIVEIMTTNTDAYDWVYNSPNYGPGSIVWSEE